MVASKALVIFTAKSMLQCLSALASPIWWLGGVLPVFLLGFIYHDSLSYLLSVWVTDENYGHGFFVPFISLFLIWQRRHTLRRRPFQGSPWGIFLIVSGMGLYIAGELGTLYFALHFSLWLVIVGLIISAIGLRGAWVISFPLLYLLTIIPLPQFLYQGLSAKLQLLSSALGVGCLQLAGITAFRDGNVIDLGPIQLEVVEACSGLRYLFALTSLALLCAYLFKDQIWKRIVLFLSSIPISIFLNAIRIGVVGILVELYGQSAAEGFYHLFEGWVLFLISLVLLMLEMLVLNRIGFPGSRGPMRDVFRFDPREESRPSCTIPQSNSLSSGSMKPTYLFSLGILVVLALLSTQLVAHEEIVPFRQAFLDFPMNMGTWQGNPIAIESQYVDALRFDDYLLADYFDSHTQPISLYIAYYRSQKKGQSVHSPQTCIPGGGWEITSLRSIEISDTLHYQHTLRVNRALIQKGEQKQVVLYWFKQRDRILTNEYLVKLFLFWDAIARQRTDGALIRLTSTLKEGEPEKDVDNRLIVFAKLVHERVGGYVPD